MTIFNLKNGRYVENVMSIGSKIDIFGISAKIYKILIKASYLLG